METRNKLDRTVIVLTAAALCEEVGLDNLTLNQLADRLKIKTPSLYNHISGLKDVYSGLSALGLQRLGEIIQTAAVGRSGDEAVSAVALEYRKFAKENPELYKAILKAPELQEPKILEAENIVTQIMFRVLEPYHYSKEETFHIIRGFRSAVHGFVSLEAAGFFRAEYDLEKSYRELVALFLSGMESRRTLP